MGVFIIQEHYGKKMHWDLRFEGNSSLMSWVIPKGPTLDPTEERLAIRLQDQELSEIFYEGMIPEDSYASGPALIWDSGYYETMQDTDVEKGIQSGNFTFRLYGENLKGVFTLTRKLNLIHGKTWTLVKDDDVFSNKGWKIHALLDPRDFTGSLRRTPYLG